MQLELGQADVAVLVELHVRHGRLEVLLAQAEADPLGQDDHAERPAVRVPLDHGRLHDVDEVVE